ncbi:hypothetical protein LTR95_006248 [Oleoguttula sp. CCFEE 5521]
MTENSGHMRHGSTSSDEPLMAQRQRKPQQGPRSESGYGSLQATSPITSTPDPAVNSPKSTTKHPYPEVLGETSDWWHQSREDFEAGSEGGKVRWIHVARMMTTDAGVLAGTPCQRCLNKATDGWDVQCIVYSAEERERYGKRFVTRCACCLSTSQTCAAKLEADADVEADMEMNEDDSDFEGSETPSSAAKVNTRGNARPAPRRVSRNKPTTPRGETVIYSDDEEDSEGASAPSAAEIKRNRAPDGRYRVKAKPFTPQPEAIPSQYGPRDNMDGDVTTATPRTTVSKSSPAATRKSSQGRPQQAHTQSPITLDDDKDEEIAVMRAEALAEQKAFKVEAFAEQYHRPRTTDTNNFWFTSRNDWEALLKDAGGEDPSTKKRARQKLRLLEKVGKLMETEDGVTVPAFATCKPCKSAGVACRVAKDENGMACAKCLRHHASCEAGKLMKRGLQTWAQATKEQPAAPMKASKKRRIEYQADTQRAQRSPRTRDSSSPEVPLDIVRSRGKATTGDLKVKLAPQPSCEKKTFGLTVPELPAHTLPEIATSEQRVKGEHNDSAGVLKIAAEREAKRLKRQREDELADAEIEVLRAEANAARKAMEADVFAAQSEAELLRAIYERKKLLDERSNVA